MPTPGPASEPHLLPQLLQKEADNTTVGDNGISQPENVQHQKRTYLSLLPPDQIIELCLTFEQHVPLPIRASLWPLDLEAEISELHNNTNNVLPAYVLPPTTPSSDHIAQPTKLALPSTPSQLVHPPGIRSPTELPVQPLDASFPTSSGDTPAENATEATEAGSTAKDAPIAVDASSGQTESSSAEQFGSGPSAGENPRSLSQMFLGTKKKDVSNLSASSKEDIGTSLSKVLLPPSTSSGTSQGTAVHPGPYPYAPYGYPLPPGYPPPSAQAAYPHTPYYPPPAAVPGYPSHYPGYPHYPPPPGYPTHQPPPPPPPPVSSEDLPSYEDMIVEALMAIREPEGAAPKDLFSWMGARWPLQTNFRPSASQALQKAFRRGRLEKMSGGRYRLNPNWEGGATSKRTTRRPQTLAQTNYAMQQSTSSQTAPSSSPFTHSPLPHRSRTSTPPQHTAQQQPYGAYAYAYGSFPGFPGYTSFSARPAAKSTQAGSATSTTVKFTLPIAVNTVTKKSTSSTGKEKDASGADAGSDAWLAAQHILKAINFGSLQDGSTDASTAPSSSLRAGTSSTAHLPPIMASLNIDVHAAVEDDGLGRTTLTGEERAALQAQLALLAAQLSEIAAEEVEKGENEDSTQAMVEERPSQPDLFPQVSQIVVTTPREFQVPSSSMIMDVNQFSDDDSGFTLLAPAAGLPGKLPIAHFCATHNQHTSTPVTTENIPDAPQHPAGPVAKSSTHAQGAPPAETASPSPDMALEEESDEDEDMEMVDVDSYMQSEGMRA
ncbi:hypothetical protein BC835DRAFT_315347 [Cytidiella melzeri]|nr:hypothetical protein BC835DRAFT_315347 [Cytidiella melzeri]